MADIHEDMTKEDLRQESIRRIQQADATFATLDGLWVDEVEFRAAHRLCAHLRQTGTALAILANLAD